MIYEFSLIVPSKMGMKYVIQYGYVFRFLTHTNGHFIIGVAPPPGYPHTLGWRIRISVLKITGKGAYVKVCMSAILRKRGSLWANYVKIRKRGKICLIES